MIVNELYTYRGHKITYEQLKPHSNRIQVHCICDNCNKVFNTTKYQITRNGHQFCQSCAIKIKELKPYAIGKKLGRLTITNFDRNKLLYTCLCECGNAIEITHNNLIMNKRKSCGCLQKEKSKDYLTKLSKLQIGENHPNWKGGITPKKVALRKTKQYKLFRTSVYERDKYTCQLCGSVGRKLVVHHLNCFQDYPNEIMNIDNGITLCEKCHKTYHKINGLHTTKEQFISYSQGGI